MLLAKANAVLTILTIFYISVTFQSLFFILSFSRFFLYKKEEKAGEVLSPVSIIVCAHNEAENLKVLIPKLLKQQYKNFEVIVVNDRSCDDTAHFLQLQESKSNILKVVNIREVPPGKKRKKICNHDGHHIS